MQNKLVIAGVIAAISLPLAAYAQVGISADIGSTGVGAHVSIPLQPNLHARFGLNFLNYSYDTNTSDVNYDFKLKLRTFDALLDYFPSASPFRLSAGVVYNGNKINANGVPSAKGTYTLNGTTYTAADAGTVVGRIDFRNAAPYLGIGWGNATQAAGWHFSGDLGAIFQGSARTTLTSSGCTGPAFACARLATDIEAEERKLSDKVDDYKIYPVLRIGASYRF